MKNKEISINTLMSTTVNNKDSQLIAEAYNKARSSHGMAHYDRPTNAPGPRPGYDAIQNTIDAKLAAKPESLKKFTVEILYPNFVNGVNNGFKSHPRSPDIRTVYASSKEEALAKLNSGGDKDVNSYKIDDGVPADAQEYARHQAHEETMTSNYDKSTKSGSYMGD